MDELKIKYSHHESGGEVNIQMKGTVKLKSALLALLAAHEEFSRMATSAFLDSGMDDEDAFLEQHDMGYLQKKVAADKARVEQANQDTRSKG